jgi:hypothetical protein
MANPTTGTKGIQVLGTVLIVLGLLCALIGTYRFQAVGAIFALVGIGLRIEAAIRDRNTP